MYEQQREASEEVYRLHPVSGVPPQAGGQYVANVSSQYAVIQYQLAADNIKRLRSQPTPEPMPEVPPKTYATPRNKRRRRREL